MEVEPKYLNSSLYPKIDNYPEFKYDFFLCQILFKFHFKFIFYVEIETRAQFKFY